jgi:diaminobutyrate-2-oxoglutarate transaminase
VAEVRKTALLPSVEPADPKPADPKLADPEPADPDTAAEDTGAEGTEFARSGQTTARRTGLIPEVGGRDGATLRVIPPLTVTEERSTPRWDWPKGPFPTSIPVSG